MSETTELLIEAIEIPNPSETIDEDSLTQIADSIKEIGLSQPIVVRQTNDLGKYVLVSGEKRLLAHKRLGLTGIKAEIRDINEKDGKVLRLHENLKRFNLPWHEQVKLVEELHLLRQSEHGTPVRTGRPPKEGEAKPKVGWSLRDTAAELDMGIGSLSEDLSLARALRNDPTLYKVQDKKTAMRLARNVMQRHQDEQNAGLPSKMEANEVYLGDSASILQNLPAQSVDHCITDPPWIKFFDSTLRLDERTVPVFKELYRVLKTGAFLFIFCGLDDYDYYVGHDEPNKDNPSERVHDPGVLEKIGFNVSNTPVIWQKENSLSRRGVRSWEYDRDFEFVIVAAKGSPALITSRRLSGIKTFKIVHPSRMIHPNEKPIDLIKDIITDCSYEGEIIVDPFGGSGALAQACVDTKRKYIVIERDKNFYDGIVKRLAK